MSTQPPKFRNNYNGKEFNDPISVNNMPSVTVPDQSMSLRQILQRYSRGLPITGNAGEPIFEGEDGIGFDIKTLDLAEREEYILKAEEELKSISERFNQKKEKDSRDTLTAQLKAEILAEQEAKKAAEQEAKP